MQNILTSNFKGRPFSGGTLDTFLNWNKSIIACVPVCEDERHDFLSRFPLFSFFVRCLEQLVVYETCISWLTTGSIVLVNVFNLLLIVVPSAPTGIGWDEKPTLMRPHKMTSIFGAEKMNHNTSSQCKEHYVYCSCSPYVLASTAAPLSWLPIQLLRTWVVYLNYFRKLKANLKHHWTTLSCLSNVVDISSPELECHWEGNQ